MDAGEARNEAERLNTLRTLEDSFRAVIQEQIDTEQLLKSLEHKILMECREDLRPIYAECRERIARSAARERQLRELLNQTHPDAWTKKPAPSLAHTAYLWVKHSALHPGKRPTAEELGTDSNGLRQLMKDPEFFTTHVIPRTYATKKNRKGEPLTVPKNYRRKEVLERIRDEARDLAREAAERFAGGSYSQVFDENHSRLPSGHTRPVNPSADFLDDPDLREAYREMTE